MGKTPETQPSPETSVQKLDVLIVMGRNFLPGYKRKQIESAKYNLSPESRMNVWAAIMLYRAGLVDKVLFSSGYTAGTDLPSEAQAMENLFTKILKLPPDVAKNVILKQEKTKSTDPESQEDKKIVDQYGFKNVGVLTTGGRRDIENPAGHIDRAVWWFEKRGLKVTPFITEEVLKTKFPRFVRKYLPSELAQKVAKQERLVSKIEKKPLGPLALKAIVWATRR